MRGRAAAASRKRQADDDGGGKTKKSNKSKKPKAEEATTTMLDDHPAPSPPPPPQPPSLVGPRGWIDRTELIRLLQQALSDDLGLEPVARALADATGVEREPAAAASLRECVSRGDWARVPVLFAELGVPRESGVGRAARFVAFRESYLEALRRGDASEAVKVLRREITPVAPDAATLRALAARLLSATRKDQEEEEEKGEGDVVVVAGSSNGAAATTAAAAAHSNGHSHHIGLHRNDDDELEAAAAAAAFDRFPSDSPLLLPPPLQPPPPASSPASAAFVFSPEAVASWRGPRSGSRERALEALQSLLLSCSSSASASGAATSVSVSGSLLPRHRLLSLLEQALSAQRSAARAHNAVPRPPLTLLADYGAAVAAAAAAGRLRCGSGATGNGFGNGGASSPPSSSLLFAPDSPAAGALTSAMPSGGGDGLPCMTAQVLLDHGDEVWHLAFSPCGSRLATGGADGVAILWSVGRDSRGRRRVTKSRELRGHAGPVALVSWSPTDGGATLATAGPDGTVRLWDGRTGERVAVLSHHGSLVTAMSWVPGLSCSWPDDSDGETTHRRACGRLVTAGHDRCVHLVDAGAAIKAAGRRRADAAAAQRRGRAAEEAGLAAASTSSSDDDDDDEEEEEEEEAPPPALSTSTASPSSRILRTWRGTRVNDLAVTPDGRTLLTVSSDRRVRFWCLASGAELFRVAAPLSASGVAVRGPRLSRLAAAIAAFPSSSSSSQQQQQQQLASPPVAAVSVISETESIISLSLSRAGDALLLNLSNQQLHAWRVPARHELAPLASSAASAASAGGEERGEGQREGPPVTMTAAPTPGAGGGGAPSSSQQPTAAPPPSSSLPSSSSALPPPPPPQPIMTYRGPPARQGRFVVRSCFGGLDDAFALSGAEDCRVYCWDRRSGELLSALDGHAGTVNAVAWNPADPGMFASASDDKSVHVWGLESDLRDEEEEEEEEEGGDGGADDGVSL